MRPHQPIATALLALLGFGLVLASASGCTGGRSKTPEMPGSGVTPLASLEGIKSVCGETIFLPIYSYIHTGNNGDPIDLAAFVSVRNTDPKHPIILSHVLYHDSVGQLIQDYAKTPLQVAPLAAAEFFLREEDTRGGSSASFRIEWQAEAQVSVPVVEAVHMNTQGRGLSFITQGRMVEPAPLLTRAHVSPKNENCQSCLGRGGCPYCMGGQPNCEKCLGMNVCPNCLKAPAQNGAADQPTIQPPK